MNKLTDEQKQEARVMFHERGMTIGEIAEHFGVSIYALTPWIWMAKATS